MPKAILAIAESAVKPSSPKQRSVAMGKASKSTTYRLTFVDAINVWIRTLRGEYQHRIAASYDVNPGRVNEVLKERRHKGSRAAALEKIKGAA